MPKAQNQILVAQINKRMDEIKMRDGDHGLDNTAMQMNQQQACRELYREMIAEDLRATADEILKYVELEPGQTVVKTSDSFRIVRIEDHKDGADESVHVNITDEDLGIK